MNPALFTLRRNVIKPPTALGNISVTSISMTADDLSSWTDWKIFGAQSNASSDDKKNTSNVISATSVTNMTRSAGPAASPTYSWTNGTTNPTGSASEAGLWVVTTGGSIGYVDHTVPAGTASHTARVLVGTYVGGRSSLAQVVRFTLSDGSFTEQVFTPNQNLGGFGRVYTYYEATYNAADNSSRTLRIRLENTPGVDADCDQEIRLLTYQ